MKNEIIAVITGDLVNSRKEITKTWMPLLKETFNVFGNQTSQWEIFRGDMFQLKVEAKKALYSAIYIKASLKMLNNLDVRMGIGIGTEAYKSDRITESNGTAYINSGEAFEKLKRKKISLVTPWPDFNNNWNLYLKLASLTMDNWTAKSAEAFLYAIKNPNSNQNELSQILGVTQSTISENLNRSGYYQLSDMITWFEHCLPIQNEEI
jgi:hypothetical protein